MAVGDLVTEDWGFEYRGLAFGGSGTMLIAPGMTGLWDTPEVNTSDQRRFRRHGLHPGDDYLGSREVIIPIEIDGANTGAWQTNLDSLKLAFAVDPESTLVEDQLVFQVPGVAGGGKRFIYARPRGLTAPIDQAWFYQLPVASARFVATSPFIYNIAATAATTTVSGASVGRAWPITWPFTWGTLTAATFAATNNGTARAEWTATFRGPLAGVISLTHTTQSKTVALTIDLAVTDSLVVDSDTRTAILNGTTNVYPAITTAQWFTLAPGANPLSFRATTGSGSVSVVYRDTWT